MDERMVKTKGVVIYIETGVTFAPCECIYFCVTNRSPLLLPLLLDVAAAIATDAVADALYRIFNDNIVVMNK